MMISFELQWSGSAGTPQIKDERSCVIVCSGISARPKHTGKAHMYAAVTHGVALSWIRLSRAQDKEEFTQAQANLHPPLYFMFIG